MKTQRKSDLPSSVGTEVPDDEPWTSDRAPEFGMRDVWLLASLYVMLYAAITFVVNAHILTPEVIARGWAGFDSEQLEEIFTSRRKWARLSYVLLPAFLLIKVAFTAVCVAVGCVLLAWQVDFRYLFRSAVLAESVFAGAAVLHVLLSLFVRDVQTVADYTTYFPLSALQLVHLTEGNSWLTYLLKTANVFEVVYVVVLARLLRPALGKTFGATTALVVATYGGGLLLVVSSVTFLWLSVI